jgi:hypothetical protein
MFQIEIVDPELINLYFMSRKDNPRFLLSRKEVLWLWKNKTDLEISTNVRIFSIPIMKNWFLECRMSVCLSVCLSVCMYVYMYGKKGKAIPVTGRGGP